MKKLTALILVCVLALTGCAEAEDGAAEQAPDGGDTGSTVSVDYASEELLGQPDAYYEFIADESEQQVKVVFSADGTVEDFKIIGLNYKDVSENGEMSFDVSGELFSLDELTAEKPVVLGMVFAGLIPNMGISYVDEQGATKNYSINMSGEDGSLLLIEF